MNSKIQTDIEELVAQRVISVDVASDIERYYSSKKSDAPNRLFTVFAVLGSTLVGLGIILILAHNWDDFSRSIKTIFAFAPLVIGQLIIGFSILKKKSATWLEGSGVFLFFAVGASMALVSQIYNIPGNFSSYLLTWILLCLPLVYLLKSNALAILHIAFTTSYACSFGYFDGNDTPWFYLLLLVLVLPYYYQLLKQKKEHNITSVFNWLVPLSVIIVLGAFVERSATLGFLMYVILFGLLYNIGKLPYFDNQKLRRNGYLILGSLGTVCMLLITSFEWLWNDILRDNFLFNSQEFYVVLVLLILTLGVLGYTYFKKWIEGFNLFQYVFILFTIIFFIGWSNSFTSLVLINLLILALGVIAIKIGADKFHFGVLNYGLLIITALIVCRFFDTDMSFVVRGLLFVSVGVGFFLTNYIMLKKQKLNSNNKK
ncbi:DUF2157 domain-containing protein [Algibacter amylolyticus]|uniref:DUF2157 domain-containing protein n=1 Tax=Algibacter amylolyticus TaxID=1608400 RepID=A0A5M7B9S3_9FLAO|nr:DUF2157 domain-containing protein [Algibacter amylolyticus]KAA5826189.1 DUF2157 domain-containing protein [Algibacter amylolyticus]MBB5268390.1 putative membrane protein [Algibacter amylolyticus]TSJ80227.1 DUF2157 domain-containing protein [Algibacter amylolyticus]